MNDQNETVRTKLRNKYLKTKCVKTGQEYTKPGNYCKVFEQQEHYKTGLTDTPIEFFSGIVEIDIAKEKIYYQILRLILIQTYYMQVPKRPVCKKHFRNSSEKFLYVAAPFMFCKVKLVKVN